jgi:hypothetical protein
VHLCINFSSQPSDLFLGTGWVKWKEKGANEGMLRQFSQKGYNILGKEGSEIGQSFTILMLRYKMIPQHLLLYEKRMVIWLGDGL